MAITDPRDISGLLAWYSPEYEAANYSDGAEVTTLTDLSGNANHATGATTSTAKPLYKATGGPSGGAERLRFENGGYFNLPSGIMGSSAAGEIMAMIKSDYLVTGTTQGFNFFGTSASSNHYGFDGGVYDGFGSTGRKGPLTPPAALNVWHRLGTWSADSDWSMQYDGTGYGATGSNTVGWATVPKIGNSKSGTADNTATNTFEGDYGAMVIYSKKLSSTERSDLAAWMAANPSGGAPDTIPEVAADWTAEGNWAADAVPVAVITADWTGVGEFTATVDSAIAPVFSSADEHVPLTVRVGDKHITREVSGLAFRKEAVGGLKSITLRLARPLNKFDPDIQALSTITVYDGRSAEIVAQGRVSDLGRSASASDGQQNEIVGFGPGQHVADKTFPYALVDTGLEAFTRSTYCVKKATATGDERAADEPSLVLSAEEGKAVSTAFIADMIHRGFKEAGMKLGRVRCRIDAGVVSADWELQLVTRDGAGSPTVADSATADTAAAILAGQVVTDFPNGDNVVSVRAVRNTSGVTATEDHWFEFWEVAIRARLKDETGADITTGYGQNYVLAHEAVKDLLGRVLDQYDGANSVIDTSGTYQIDQFAYFDGVTAEQVLNDLMVLEPAYRWWAEPNATGTAYVFHWEAWPTTVRYEVTLDDGGDFPASAQELYNEVTVRWRGPNGRTRSVTRTLACAILDDAGITRSTVIDLGDEVGSAAAATRAGDNFLAEHNVPANAGTITISRPIRDLVTGRTVRPHQIREGELIRVRGIESYPDALNASSNDGQTVFRIWSVTYSSDTDSAACELDIPSRSTTNALVKLAKRRPRKR